MVSFQCNGCGDIVKKPKLDQHGCCSTFDCIDCSKTFNNPSEYRGHTSCISEAEKYQKGLYKGPKTGANGLKINNSHQSNPLPNKKIATNTAPRQSNAQWNKISQPTSSDNVNGYPDPQHQQAQNGWRNGHDNHRYSDRGRKSSNWQQNGYSRSSASGANDTPLGTSRRSSVDDPVVVTLASGPGNLDVVIQGNSQAEETEAKGKPPKEKRKSKVVGSTDNSSSQTEEPTELDTAKADKNSAVVNERKSKKRKKKDEACSETGTAKAGSDTKEEVRKETKRREKEVDIEQSLEDGHAAGSEDKEKMKKEKRRKEAVDEPHSVHEDDAGSEDKRKGKKEKKRKEKNPDKAAEDTEIPASVEEQATKVKKRKKKGITDEIAIDPENLVVENAEVVSDPVHDQTTKKSTKGISETVTHVGKEEKQKKKERKRREKESVQDETGVSLKDRKRKRHEPDDSIAEKKRIKH